MISKKKQGGFTLIELMIVVAIIGILAAVAIPAFMKYIKKSKTSEARSMVQKIYAGAREYWMDRNTVGGAAGMTAQAQESQFPESTLDADTFVADADCCAMGGTNEKCMPQQSLWTADAFWTALKFSMDDPHYFSYNYTSEIVSGDRAGGNNFTARARGDLDCDTEYSTYSMYGVVNATYADGPAGSAAIARVNELE